MSYIRLADQLSSTAVSTTFSDVLTALVDHTHSNAVMIKFNQCKK